MPRIAVAVAVVAIVGVSIGVNIARYPTVWTMAGTSPTVSASSVLAPNAVPADSEPITDLTQVAPPETYGLPRADAAPIRPIASEPIALPDRGESSPGPDESAETPKGARVAAKLISSPTGELPEPIEGGSALAGLSAETRRDSPAFGSKDAAEPADVREQTRWPAEASASMRFAAKPTPPAELSPWRTKKALVPVDWGNAPAEEPSSRVLLTSDGRRIERLPPIDAGGR